MQHRWPRLGTEMGREGVVVNGGKQSLCRRSRCLHAPPNLILIMELEKKLLQTAFDARQTCFTCIWFFNVNILVPG